MMDRMSHNSFYSLQYSDITETRLSVYLNWLLHQAFGSDIPPSYRYALNHDQISGFTITSNDLSIALRDSSLYGTVCRTLGVEGITETPGHLVVIGELESRGVIDTSLEKGFFAFQLYSLDMLVHCQLIEGLINLQILNFTGCAGATEAAGFVTTWINGTTGSKYVDFKSILAGKSAALVDVFQSHYPDDFEIFESVVNSLEAVREICVDHFPHVIPHFSTEYLLIPHPSLTLYLLLIYSAVYSIIKPLFDNVDINSDDLEESNPLYVTCKTTLECSEDAENCGGEVREVSLDQVSLSAFDFAEDGDFGEKPTFPLKPSLGRRAKEAPHSVRQSLIFEQLVNGGNDQSGFCFNGKNRETAKVPTRKVGVSKLEYFHSSDGEVNQHKTWKFPKDEVNIFDHVTVFDGKHRKDEPKDNFKIDNFASSLPEVGHNQTLKKPEIPISVIESCQQFQTPKTPSIQRRSWQIPEVSHDDFNEEKPKKEDEKPDKFYPTTSEVNQWEVRKISEIPQILLSTEGDLKNKSKISTECKPEENQWKPVDESIMDDLFKTSEPKTWDIPKDFESELTSLIGEGQTKERENMFIKRYEEYFINFENNLNWEEARYKRSLKVPTCKTGKISCTPAVPPKVRPKTWTNRKKIILALKNALLSGHVDKSLQHETIMNVNSERGFQQFMVLMGGIRLKYKGVYVFVGNVAKRISGVGPDEVREEIVSAFYKYDCASRVFVALWGMKSFSAQVDGFTLLSPQARVMSLKN